MTITTPLLLRYRAIALGLCAMAVVGCKQSPSGPSVAAGPQAQAPKTAECAACSMVVREQPAPRAQLVHRDNTRKFFCSIGDLVQYLREPSPHGMPQGIFVEANDPAHDPTTVDSKARPWIRAETAHYVIGVARPRVMGPPVLVYQSASDAARIAGAHQARVVRYAGLAAALAAAKRAVHERHQPR
ncbi:MAG: nitrous oxide reductase accessory protein NosL [Deltaproteobacteria bacterium]|nr:nitrous oxide reductase accessory protein NosL [Deltaproteobacteria bacterium]